MNDFVSEPVGFRFTLGGFSAWFISMLAQYDLTQVVGFIGLVIGLAIQVVSWYRNNKSYKVQEEAEKRAKEADDRDKLQYELQMRILAKQLAEIERDKARDDKST